MVRVQSVLLTTATGDFNWRKRIYIRMEKKSEKKFVRYKEGAEMYSISQSLFERVLYF